MGNGQRDLSKLSDEELAALETALAKQKRAIADQQVAVENEKQFRAATVNLSPTQREAFAIRIGGTVGSNGEAS